MNILARVIAVCGVACITWGALTMVNDWTAGGVPCGLALMIVGVILCALGLSGLGK